MKIKTGMDVLRKGEEKETELTCPVQLLGTPIRIHYFLTGKTSVKGQKEACIIMLAFTHEENIMNTE